MWLWLILYFLVLYYILRYHNKFTCTLNTIPDIFTRRRSIPFEKYYNFMLQLVTMKPCIMLCRIQVSNVSALVPWILLYSLLEWWVQSIWISRNSFLLTFYSTQLKYTYIILERCPIHTVVYLQYKCVKDLVQRFNIQ